MKSKINENGSAVIVLDETFDFRCVDEFRSSYETFPAHSIKDITIDFHHTRYMDSSALGMLLNLKSYFSGKAIKISLANANEQINKIFKITHFEKKFIIL